MTSNKCRARVPAQCVDPQCPERRSYTHQLQTATTYNQYESAARKRDEDQARIFANRNAAPKPAPRAPININTGPSSQKKEFGSRGNKSAGYQNRGRRYDSNNGIETLRSGECIKKFHKEIGFPQGFHAPQGSREVIYSNHAKQQADEDYFARIPVLPKVNLDKMELIEVKMSVSKGRPYRYLYRAELDDETDVCFVLQPSGRGPWQVVTVWANERSDKHKGLDHSQYVDPNQKAV